MAKLMKFLGRVIAEHIVNLNIPLEKTELIGLSLGAHVMGFAGKNIQKISGNKVWRIVGLDTSGPLFEYEDANNSLAKTDAKSVIAIHTDGGVNGLIRTTGSIDFYPNGGIALQPGCEHIQVPEGVTFNDLFNSGYYTILCSHGRSIMYFTESVNSDLFIATECPKYSFYLLNMCSSNRKVIMGESTPENAEGVFYLKTGSSSPYALG